MADHPTYSGLGLKHISLVAVLLCFLLQVTSGFSISQNKADFSEKDRFKREVYPGYQTLCKANARNCDPMALMDRRSKSLWQASKRVTHQAAEEKYDQGTQNGDDAFLQVLRNSLTLMESKTTKPPHSVHCKSSPRVPCGTDSSGRKRSGRFPDWTQEVQDELASIGYGDDILPSGLRRPQENLSLLETMSRLKARMSNWRLQTSRLPGQELTKDLPTSSNAEELYGRFLPTTDFD